MVMDGCEQWIPRPMLGRRCVGIVAAMIYHGMPCAAAAQSDPGATPAARTGSRSLDRDRREADSPSTQEVIVVTAARKAQPLRDVTVATEVLTREEIAISGARDAAELLEERPGMFVSSGFAGTDVQLQGLDNKYVLILVDGERVTGRVDGSIDLSRYRADGIERIEIVRGPASALYGADAVGGVINIITRGARQPLGGELHGAYGSRRRVELDVAGSARRNPINARLSAALRRSDAYDREPASAATDADTFDEIQLGGRVGVGLSADWTLQGQSNFRLRHGAGVDQNGAGFISDRTHDTHELIASVSARHGFSLGTWSLSGHYTRFDDLYAITRRAAGRQTDEERNIDQLARVGSQIDLDLSASHRLSLGTEVLAEQLDSPRVTASRARRARLGIYGEHEWQLSTLPQLVLAPGARVDLDTRFGPYFTPRLAVRFDPTPTVALRASYGWAFRAPSFKELALRFANESANYFVEGNPDLVPERSRGGTLGLELRPTAMLWLVLSAYRNDLRQMIGTEVADGAGGIDAPTRYRYDNIARARTQGVDATLRLKPLPNLEFEGGYSWSLTFDEIERRPLPARPRHRGTGRILYRCRTIGLSATARASLVGRQPFFADWDGDGDSEARFSPAYGLLDLRVEQAVLPWLALALGVNNALSAGDDPLLNLLPRSYYAGLWITLPRSPDDTRGSLFPDSTLPVAPEAL